MESNYQANHELKCTIVIIYSEMRHQILYSWPCKIIFKCSLVAESIHVLKQSKLFFKKGRNCIGSI